ncbi:MAG TPA: bifunctional phosphopantothenoylcysteine decarboxylase/phosphopantothenate--cysteine ligase CoaBC [Blastocatellia bacterium]|nr:bifunctional phosphopantothenoylcysteine decarboxylase/phosphopantothenate--cysteine ligase CoaBC [Blastocatellia bacterium]
MKVALGVTGCIGAYKAVEVLRGLQKRGASVQVVMTRHATRFVTPLTFQAISGLPVIVDMFEATADPEIKHIQIAQSIDLLLVAPATANILAKFANGIADDFLSTLYISTPAAVVVAPAMNSEMWLHPATQENVVRLRKRGVIFVDPGEGYLACRTVGPGRLAEPEEILERAFEVAGGKDASRLSTDGLSTAGERTAEPTLDLIGERVLVTAGPTYEAIDPVRGLTNRSSGKMGYALAEAAVARGAEVILVSGPVSLVPPGGVRVERVTSAAEMYQSVMTNLIDATIVVMAAAVADFRPTSIAQDKIKKTGYSLLLELEKTEDILQAVGRSVGSRVVVGFAAETENIVPNARRKLAEKGADLIVANDVSSPGSGFDVETNRVILVSGDGEESLPLLTKREVADRILDVALAAKTKSRV